MTRKQIKWYWFQKKNDIKKTYLNNLEIFGQTAPGGTPSAATMETTMFGTMAGVSFRWGGQLTAEDHPVS